MGSSCSVIRTPCNMAVELATERPLTGQAPGPLLAEGADAGVSMLEKLLRRQSLKMEIFEI